MNDECLVNYKYYFSDRFNLFKGDSRQVLPLMKDNSIDSVVCDPPYELGFMGKSWDSTGVANDVNLWKEVLRVLKPGGHLLSFGGSRTYHRMAVAIEDAGFEIRDQIMWVYGSGFPKSLNIGKQLDEWKGWGTALKPAHEPIVLARKPFEGTVANNVLTFGVGGINIDGTRVGSETVSVHHAPKGTFAGGEPDRGSDTSTYENHTGRFPANFIHDGSDEVVALFPEKAGGGHWAKTKVTGFGEFGGGKSEYLGQGEKDGFGSAARFFYCAKANKRDRNEGLDGFETKEIHRYGAGIGEGLTPNAPALDKNHHPTVKPTDLMQYLCRLITPPNGTILDPFLGSGSTGKAAMYEGFNFRRRWNQY